MAEPSFPEIIRAQIEAGTNEDAKRLIEDWIKEGRLEDLYLDFTTKKDPARGALAGDDTRGFAKALSGFANSDGGLLVWGVQAKKVSRHPDAPDKAQSPEVISFLDTFVGALNGIVKESTKPVVPGVVNLPVWKDRGAGSGWVLSYVPAGPNPPYRADICNNNYYKRAGSSFYPMEPYDVRDVVFRFRHPKIRLDMTYTCGHWRRNDYALRVDAANAGPSALREWKVQVDMPDFVVRTNEDIDHYHRRMDVGSIARWEARSAEDARERWIIYPGDERTLVGPEGILHIEFSIPENGWKQIEEAKEAGHAEPEVVCRLFGVDMPPVEARSPARSVRDEIR